MTPCGPLLVLVIAICSLDAISGASFSNVIVQRGSDVLPIEYINYNPSALTYTSQVARLSQAPLQSVISEPLASSVLSPCVSPCVIPNAAPIHSTANAKIVTYKASAPSVPVILTNKDEARGYQYAYAVFDEETGDKKTQSEHSDGSVVQGHYSFIQPDGFLREVVYTADDLKGFNAIVRNISPEPEHKHPAETEKEKEEKKPTVPCTKNEHLTHKHESHEEGSSEVISVPEHLEPEHLEPEHLEPEHLEPEHLEVEHLEEIKNEVASTEKVNEPIAEKIVEKIEEKPEEIPQEDKPQEDKPQEDKPQEDKPQEDKPQEDKSHEDKPQEDKPQEDKPQEDKSHEDKSHEDKSHEDKPHEEVHPTIESEESHDPNVVISYSDIIKCLKSKLHGSQSPVSPLTYVLLPSSYKPC